MTTKQILLYNNEMLTSFLIWVSIHTEAKADQTERLYVFDELSNRKNERGRYYIDYQNMSEQKRKPTDLFIDEETGYIGRKNKNNLDTSKLDIGIHDDDDDDDDDDD